MSVIIDKGGSESVKSLLLCIAFVFSLKSSAYPWFISVYVVFSFVGVEFLG